MKKSTLLAVFTTVLLFFAAAGSGWAQTTIFTESMGTVSSTTTIAAHETANGFDNDDFTMTSGGAANAADIRSTNASSGYTGASGLANVWFTSTSGNYGFAIEGINVSAYTSLSVQFGYRKESATALPTLTLDYWNGSEYVNVPFSFTQAANASVAWYLSPVINLPAAAQINGLRLRWVKSGTVAVRIDDVVLIGTAAGSPAITVTGTFNNFTTTTGTPSASQSVAVSGANLTANIDVSAVAGYEYSTTNAAPWTSTLSLASSFNGNVYVRLTGASAGTFNGTIAFSSTGAATVNKSVSGTVTPPPPANDNCAGAIALTLDATAVTGDVAGATQSIAALSCGGSTGTADDDVWYSFTTTAAGTYTITVIGSTSFDAVVDLRSGACNGTNIDCADATYSGGTETITTTLSEATTYYVRVYSYGSSVPATTTFTIGVATATSPTISVSTFSLSGFTYLQGSGPSTEQTFTVEGVNLTANLTVSPSTNYEVSLTSGSGYSTPISLTPSSGSVATTTIYVRLKAGLTAGNYNSENVAASSTGASTQNVVCSGTVGAPLPTLPLYENFSYTVGQDLTANGWNITGTNASPTIAVTAASISYPGYLSSGIGEEVTMTVSGQDVNKAFAAQTSGTVYASFLVNVSSVATGGDYFFHLGETTIGSTFRGRVFVKRDASNKLAFGIAQSTTPVAYTAFSYDMNTTYLIVLKFDMVSGTGNDVSSIYINPPLNAAIPATGWLANTDASGTDLAGVGSVALRQGGTSAPTLKLDGIRISTNWADIVGAVPITSTTYTGTGDWSSTGNWSNGLPSASIDAIVDGEVTVDIAAETKDLTINSGRSVNISGTKSLKVNGTLTNNAGASGLVVESGGSLMEESGVQATVKRNISGGQWHLISAPTSNATSTIFHNDFLQTWDEANHNWSYITEDGIPLAAAQGYSLWSDAGGTYSFTGTLNTGNKSVAITYQATSGDNIGANLVGNPYPSFLDWDGLRTTYGAIYYYAGSGYQTWNNGGVGSRYAVPCQGFFIVKDIDVTATHFTVSNSNRTNIAGTWYKSTNELRPNTLVLETTGNSYTDKLFVEFNPEAGEAFDLVHDAYKFVSTTDGVSQLYSYTGDKKLSIDVRPACEVIQLGFTNTQSGQYQIGISQMADISKATLEDTKSGTFHNLLNGPYTFNYTAGEDDKRFKLKMGTVGIPEPTQTTSSIYSYDKTAIVDLPANVSGNVYIYNLAGQPVAVRESATGQVRIGLSPTGVYVVKVVTEKETLTKKVWIR